MKKNIKLYLALIYLALFLFAYNESFSQTKSNKTDKILSASIKFKTLDNGESLCPNTTFLIEWEGVLPIDTVKLEYSTNGGVDWIIIADSATGLKYSWTVPNTPSTNCIARVTAKSYFPVIDVLTPDIGYIGDEVSIFGKNFGTIQDTNKVSFTGSNVIQYLSWSDTLVKVAVPVDAITGKVSVTVNGIKSNEVDFTVSLSDTMCTQNWSKKNLDVTTYRNGEPIRYAETETDWLDAADKQEGAWCYHSNDPANGEIYGKLYNWYAVTDPRGLAPLGWHVSTDAEWTKLINCLGGINVAGGKLKSTGTIEGGDGLWYSPNLGATNSSGFSALPSDSRWEDGTVTDNSNLGYVFYGWTSTQAECHSIHAYIVALNNNKIDIYRGGDSKAYGLSVRCVRD